MALLFIRIIVLRFETYNTYSVIVEVKLQSFCVGRVCLIGGLPDWLTQVFCRDWIQLSL